MSMVGQALLMTVARALSGQTWAGDAVLEQPIDPVVEVLRKDDGTGKPVLAVYVEQVEGSPVGLETQAGPQSVTLKVIIYVPQSWRQVGAGVVFENEGVGLSLNVIARQIDRALHTGNEAWVDILRTLAKAADEKKSRYLLIEIENGLRIPAMEISYRFSSTVNEPEFGCALYGGWLKLDAALRAAGETAVADIMKDLIVAPEGLPDYRQFQISRNISDQALRSTGLAPMATQEDGSVPVLGNAEIDIEIDVTAPGQ